ncbi:MRPL22 [Mytilus edulis]|uniref:Large ribosomal subunit protein uL22m n=1 Tax=Mytilus edulis TaxID=6550 RepID=A0A8S3QNG5_MYTED|nr:MRPL22 [Mytilus edulis]
MMSLKNLCRLLRHGSLQTRLLANESLGSRLFQSSSAINQSVICCGSSVNQSTHKLSGCRQFHTSIPRNDENESMPDPETGWPKLKEEKEWLDYNKIVYPPQKPGDPKRPAEICHLRKHIKYSPKKLWYHALMIRGMSVDEAIKQLSFQKHKGAHIIKETIEECQEIAVKDHNVEFKSNMWVEDSFMKQSAIVKGFRIMGRGRGSRVRYRYVHYFLRLREGNHPSITIPHQKQDMKKWRTILKTREKGEFF